MSAIIIDGRKTRDALMSKLRKQIDDLSFEVKLAIIQVGDRADSTSFIKAKKIFAAKLGVHVVHEQFPESVTESELLTTIENFNKSKDIKGIIVQLPLPSHIDKKKIIDSIIPSKDVDALTSRSVSEWQSGKGIMPATARGIKELLNFYDINLQGKKVTVIGRSELVGTPIAFMCRNAGATVTVCHSQTADVRTPSRESDILIVAVGKPGLITLEYVNAEQVVIDVGITRIGTESLVGDVDFASVSPVVHAISPVPGGVGAMTVLALFENLADLAGK